MNFFVLFWQQFSENLYLACRYCYETVYFDIWQSSLDRGQPVAWPLPVYNTTHKDEDTPMPCSGLMVEHLSTYECWKGAGLAQAV
jgi:hypothetical protein